jgi:hypothetical protein
MWWKDKITKNVAIEFLNECTEYTKSLIWKYNKDIKKPKTKFLFDHHIDKKNDPFKPEGVIVHSTLTDSHWDTIHCMNTGRYSTHFIITDTTSDVGKYMGDLPAIILAPMDYTKLVSHAGYISNSTYGIDIRNNGLLRPWNSIIREHKPGPIFGYEDTFNLNKIVNTSIQSGKFSRNNLWRSKTDCSAHIFMKRYYECINEKQLKSLIILLNVLEKVIDRPIDYILPSHCINKTKQPTFPGINWNEIHNSYLSRKPNNEIYMRGTTNNPLISFASSFLDYKPSIDISYVDDILQTNNWRNIIKEEDITNLTKTKNDIELSEKIKKELYTIGYPIHKDMNKFYRMFLIGNDQSLLHQKDGFVKLKEVADEYLCG